MLSHNNKPDELEEALRYYRLRADPPSRSITGGGAEPDVSAAFTLANLYHYGVRGMKQDPQTALKYYEIAAEAGSWEAAGQAGKFHLWGMGVKEGDRDLAKSYRYFLMGAPGGHEGCSRRLRSRSASRGDQLGRHRAKKEKEREAGQEEDHDEDGGGGAGGGDKGGDKGNDDYDYEYVDEQSLCDHPCVNGLGLLHVFGVPDLVEVDVPAAKKYFALARDMGNRSVFCAFTSLGIPGALLGASLVLRGLHSIIFIIFGFFAVGFAPSSLGILGHACLACPWCYSTRFISTSRALPSALS